MMARRVVTARDQVDMLSPWRTAGPHRSEPVNDLEGLYWKNERNDGWYGCRGCGAGQHEPCAPDCASKSNFMLDARDYDENVRAQDEQPCYMGCGAGVGEPCAASCPGRAEDAAWRRYERGDGIGFVHDWWLDHNGRNQGSTMSSDDFLDYFRDEKWGRSGDAKYDHDKHGETQEEADEVFERQMEGDWGGPYDDDYDEDDDEDEDEDEDDEDEDEDEDGGLRGQQLNMGQGLAWMIKHQNDVRDLPGTGDLGGPDDPRIKGASRLAQMSWDEVMRHIDEALAAGEPEDHSDYSTDYYEDEEHFDTEEDFDDPDPNWYDDVNLDENCANCGKRAGDHFGGVTANCPVPGHTVVNGFMTNRFDPDSSFARSVR